MGRTETTKFLGELLVNTRLATVGKHWAREVSIDPWTANGKRVDYMQFSPADQCSVSGIEKGYIVTTMGCYKDILPDFRSGKFAKHIREEFPESSSYYGVMVAIPDGTEIADEFEKPTPIKSNMKRWKLAIVMPCRVGPRKRSMTELLFCMLRSGH